MSAATLWQLFDETPRPPPLPPAPYPNHHPFAVRIDDPPPAVVPVESGPLSTYWSHEVPIPGQGENAPPPWWPYSPQQDSPCPSPPALSCPSPPASSRHFGTGCEGVDHFLRPAKHLPAEPSFEEEGGRLVGVFHLLFSI